jgi:hypothetical protein
MRGLAKSREARSTPVQISERRSCTRAGPAFRRRPEPGIAHDEPHAPPTVAHRLSPKRTTDENSCKPAQRSQRSRAARMQASTLGSVGPSCIVVSRARPPWRKPTCTIARAVYPTAAFGRLAQGVTFWNRPSTVGPPPPKRCAGAMCSRERFARGTQYDALPLAGGPSYQVRCSGSRLTNFVHTQYEVLRPKCSGRSAERSYREP